MLLTIVLLDNIYVHFGNKVLEFLCERIVIIAYLLFYESQFMAKLQKDHSKNSTIQICFYPL